MSLFLQGIIDAIEVESKQPSPSHGNLARLITIALSHIAGMLEDKNPVVTSATVTTNSEHATVSLENQLNQEPIKKAKNASRARSK
jgi:hypothetical protein